jgi:class 3 adenylate cyclase/Tfp pilus assembly protein PilE
MANETTPNAAPAPLERRLATILCADVAGYSNMMGANEEQTVQVFRGHREIFESLVNLHRGRIFNTAGDALLVEFNSAVEAVRCATEIQAALATRNEHLAPGEKMLFRIGINLGDVIVQGGDLLGDGVNVAARIQTGTEPGGIRISGSVYDQIQNKLSLGFKLLGEQTYKNIAKPVRTYAIREGAAATAPARRVSTKIAAAIAAALLVIAGAAYWGYQEYAARREEQAQLMAQLAAQKEATEQAQRAAEDTKRDALLQTQKQAAEETLRRAQVERNRLEQDRKAIESERRAADAAKKQTAALPASPVAAKSAAQYDGTYNGRLCSYFRERTACRPVALVVRNGIAEGSWTTVANKTSTVKGTVDANGALELTMASWTLAGKLSEASLAGHVVDHAITASGQYRNGVAISGNWKRAQ